MVRLKSIKAKLALFFGVLLLVVCAGLAIVSYITSENALSSTINESLSNMAREASDVVEAEINSQLNALEAIAESDWMKSDKLTLDEKLELLKNEVKRSGHTNIGIADLQGNVKSTDGTAANIADRDYFKKAMDGEKEVSDPLISKSTKKVVVVFAVPIKVDGKVVGVLRANRDGNALSDITDTIKFGENSSAFMINNVGTVVAHKDRNLVINMNNDLENVKKDSSLESVSILLRQMADGKAGTGEYTYKGVSKYMGFCPVQGTRWSLAITAPKSEVMARVNSLAITMLVISIIFLFVGVIITLFIAAGISKPVKTVADYLNVVATGDFTGEIPDKLLRMEDETGILAKAVNTMQGSIKHIIKAVVSESTNVSQMLVKINSEMGVLNRNIEEISATTEELSAGTEETAASTQEMNATSEEIETAIESIAAKAQEGALNVKNVNDMALEMKKNAIASKGDAVEIYERTKKDLHGAIEQSKSVNKINELSDAILEITSQTNLLALNAAIEAARAGEAGKGFAVVAEEIRKLAEDSKNTVSRIQEVTKVIFESVNALSLSSREIMEFIDKKVLNDYEYLVSSSEQYSLSSENMNDMVTDFSATSEQILASMQNMVKAIDEIAGSSNEEAQGASNIAQGAASIAQMSNEVIKMSETAKEKSDLLIKTVSQFRV